MTQGSVVSDGSNMAVQRQLRNVRRFKPCVVFLRQCCSRSAEHKSVATWGDAAHDGAGSAVQGQLRNVQQIQPCVRFS